MLRLLVSVRFLLLIASLGGIAGALLMFALGTTKLMSAAQQFLDPPVDSRAVTTAVMGATDAFLFGLVLIIFALTIAFGFVVDHSEAATARLPRWMRVAHLSDLKQALIEVIIVYLVVDTATDLAAAESVTWLSLVKPLTVIAVAGALRLMHGTNTDSSM